MEDLQEFLLISPSSGAGVSGSGLANETAWSHNATLILIELYKQNRNKVGTFEIRNLKKLWEVIANEINNILRTNFTAAQVENRWRVLERNYKKVIDNNNKTGRGRKYFQYEKEMDDIFDKKRNIHPELLLDSSTLQILKPCEQNPNYSEQNESNSGQIINQQRNISIERENQENEDISMLSTTPKSSKVTSKLRHKKLHSKNDTLLLMRQDKKIYYEETVLIQKEKLVLERERLKVMKEQGKDKKRRNELIEERNKLLKLYLEKNINLPDVM